MRPMPGNASKRNLSQNDGNKSNYKPIKNTYLPFGLSVVLLPTKLEEEKTHLSVKNLLS